MERVLGLMESFRIDQFTPEQKKDIVTWYVRYWTKVRRRFRRTRFHLETNQQLAHLFNLSIATIKEYCQDLPAEIRNYRATLLRFEGGKKAQALYGSPLIHIPREVRAERVRQTLRTNGNPLSGDWIDIAVRKERSKRAGQNTYRRYLGDAGRKGQLQRQVKMSRPEALFAQALGKEDLYAFSREEAEAGQLYFYDQGLRKRGIIMADERSMRFPDFFVHGEQKVVEVWGNIHSREFAQRLGKPDSWWRPELVVEQYARVGWGCMVIMLDNNNIEDPLRMRNVITEVKEWISNPRG